LPRDRHGKPVLLFYFFGLSVLHLAVVIGRSITNDVRALLRKLMVDFRAAVAKEAAEDTELTSLCHRR
jgi:hypothetical protein